jgi:uncharacterized membrane protein YadS
MRGTSPWLLGVIIALLAVGFVSHTLLRHAIQIAPCILSLFLLWRGYKWAPMSAMPIFAVWFILMTMIWLFLLGISHFISGHFTLTEIILTIVIAACCLGGFSTSLRDYKSRSLITPLLVFMLFFGLQAGAIWFSMHTPFSRM